MKDGMVEYSYILACRTSLTFCDRADFGDLFGDILKLNFGKVLPLFQKKTSTLVKLALVFAILQLVKPNRSFGQVFIQLLQKQVESLYKCIIPPSLQNALFGLEFPSMDTAPNLDPTVLFIHYKKSSVCIKGLRFAEAHMTLH
jgi:hypothetical protein